MLEIGSSLREARRRRGVELSDAADATMIRARYLEALETEHFDVLPEGPYLRSFLREYAEFLGLDGDLLVSEWTAQFAPPPAEPPEPPRRSLIDRLPSARVLRRGGVVVLAVAAAAIVVWRLGSSPATTAHSASPPPTVPPPAVSTPTAPEVARTVTPKPHPSLALAAARGRCWVLVRIGSGDGQLVAERTLEPGQTLRFGLKRPLWIRLGAPWNVDISVGTRSVHVVATAPRNVIATSTGVRPA